MFGVAKVVVRRTTEIEVSVPAGSADARTDNLIGRIAMNASNKVSRVVITALLAGGALIGASSAFAQYAPMHMPPPTYAQPHMIPAGLHVSIGWHGDRYWDGHRYWRHDEWMRRHPHDRDPYRDHDHRPPPHRY